MPISLLPLMLSMNNRFDFAGFRSWRCGRDRGPEVASGHAPGPCGAFAKTIAHDRFHLDQKTPVQGLPESERERRQSDQREEAIKARMRAICIGC